MTGTGSHLIITPRADAHHRAECRESIAVCDATAMRRHLVLVRHAKSAWDDPSLADHDRPLAGRGIKALPRIRDHLALAAHAPELVLCSTSRRTMDTLAGIEAAWSDEARIETERAFYDANADALLGRLRRVGSDIGCAMVIGHNPALQELAISLVGAGDPERLARLAAKLPTGATATLSFEGAWGDLGAGTARLDDFFTPRSQRP